MADLFEALMLESANDAAVTLAEGIAGSRAGVRGGDERARRPARPRRHELRQPDRARRPGNYSTARDLAALACACCSKPRFARVVDLPAAKLESGARQRTVDNRNDLIAAYPFVDGVKTGHTLQAGYVLVGAAHGRNGGRVISVVMGEPSEAARDADTLALLRWGSGALSAVRVLDRRRSLASAAIEYRDERARWCRARDGRHAARRRAA